MKFKWIIVSMTVVALLAEVSARRVASAQPFEVNTPHEGGLTGIIIRTEIALGVNLPRIAFMPIVCAEGDPCGDTPVPDFPCDPCTTSYCAFSGDYGESCIFHDSACPPCEIADFGTPCM